MADCDAYMPGVLRSWVYFIVGFLWAATNIRELELRTYRKIPHGLRTSHFGLNLWCRRGEVAPNVFKLPALLAVVAGML